MEMNELEKYFTFCPYNDSGWNECISCPEYDNCLYKERYRINPIQYLINFIKKPFIKIKEKLQWK